MVYYKTIIQKYKIHNNIVTIKSSVFLVFGAFKVEILLSFFLIIC